MFVHTYPLYRAKIVQIKRKSKENEIYLSKSMHHPPLRHKGNGSVLYISKMGVTNL